MSSAEEQAADHLRELTEEIEAEKAEKKRERLRKKKLKERHKKREQRERWVAPILLILTAILSYLLILIF